MAVKYKFIADIIDKNWFQHINEQCKRKWTFEDDIKSLSDGQLKELLYIFFECIEIKIGNEELDNIITSLKKNEIYKVNDFIVDINLVVKFFKCITMSEYSIDSILLHPPEMRLREFKQISDLIEIEENILRKIDSNWHSTIREKIYDI